MDKSFFTNVFTNVNTAAFHSSHLGVTCHALHPLRSSVPPFLRFGCLRSKWRLQRKPSIKLTFVMAL
jgi:hypothetical protein